MRRILLLITDLEVGGTPTVVRELAIRLQPFASVQVACLASWGPVADELRSAGVKVTALGAKHLADFTIVRNLAALVDAEQIDTLFSFLVHANALAATIKVMRPQVRIVQSIQTTQPRPRWHWQLQRLIQRSAERVVVPSPSVAHVAERWSCVPVEKLEVIPNAVELPVSFQRKGRNGPIRIGFIGRLDPIKRVGDLIAAMNLLSEDYQLSIYGNGAERDALQRLIESADLIKRVSLKGPITLPWDALAEMDLLALPSDAEGFGLVLIEAMAAGVPVVATDVPGIWDVVRHARTGLLVPPRDPAALARAIHQVSSDASMRQRLTQAAAADVQGRFSWATVLPMYCRLLLGST